MHAVLQRRRCAIAADGLPQCPLQRRASVEAAVVQLIVRSRSCKQSTGAFACSHRVTAVTRISAPHQRLDRVRRDANLGRRRTDAEGENGGGVDRVHHHHRRYFIGVDEGGGQQVAAAACGTAALLNQLDKFGKMANLSIAKDVYQLSCTGIDVENSELWMVVRAKRYPMLSFELY